jgi:hypothetical protein
MSRYRHILRRDGSAAVAGTHSGDGTIMPIKKEQPPDLQYLNRMKQRAV